jgi:guanine deaminase
MCLGAIYWARLGRVYYGGTASDAAAAGFDDQFIYDEISREPAGRKISMEQMLRMEALAAFRAWRESGNKTPY